MYLENVGDSLVFTYVDYSRKAVSSRIEIRLSELTKKESRYTTSVMYDGFMVAQKYKGIWCHTVQSIEKPLGIREVDGKRILEDPQVRYCDPENEDVQEGYITAAEMFDIAPYKVTSKKDWKQLASQVFVDKKVGLVEYRKAEGGPGQVIFVSEERSKFEFLCAVTAWEKLPVDKVFEQFRRIPAASYDN